MSFRLPEFQYSVPIFARPRYNELYMYFLCFTLPNSWNLPCACQISLDTGYVIWLPEFQYSVPIFARPRYNELHMYFLRFTLPNSLSLPCACQISLKKAMSFGCQNFNILYRSSLDPDMINYLCIFHVLALPKSWN